MKAATSKLYLARIRPLHYEKTCRTPQPESAMWVVCHDASYTFASLQKKHKSCVAHSSIEKKISVFRMRDQGAGWSENFE
jgi:hypothetical protein